MCRYSDKRYKYQFTCFNCRKTFKSHGLEKCPECSGEVVLMGRDFKTPPRNDLRQWKTIEKLSMLDIRFRSCGCGRVGTFVPSRPNQVEELHGSAGEVALRRELKRMSRGDQARRIYKLAA